MRVAADDHRASWFSSSFSEILPSPIPYLVSLLHHSLEYKQSMLNFSNLEQFLSVLNFFGGVQYFYSFVPFNFPIPSPSLFSLYIFVCQRFSSFSWGSYGIYFKSLNFNHKYSMDLFFLFSSPYFFWASLTFATGLPIYYILVKPYFIGYFSKKYWLCPYRFLNPFVLIM